MNVLFLDHPILPFIVNTSWKFSARCCLVGCRIVLVRLLHFHFYDLIDNSVSLLRFLLAFKILTVGMKDEQKVRPTRAIYTLWKLGAITIVIIINTVDPLNWWVVMNIFYVFLRFGPWRMTFGVRVPGTQNNNNHQSYAAKYTCNHTWAGEIYFLLWRIFWNFGVY